MNSIKLKHSIEETNDQPIISLGETDYQKRHGERLKSIRKQLGKNQEDMAETLGIDVKTYRDAEKGENYLSSVALVRLYIKTGYNINWLLGMSEISKDEDNIFSVDIRDMVKIEDDKVTITIKSKLFEYLSKREAGESISVMELDDSTKKLCEGVAKQRRRYFLLCDDGTYYSASINISDFAKEEKS